MRFSTLQQMAFLGLLIVITLTFLHLIGGFLFSIFWAIVFSILFRQIYAWLLEKTYNKASLSAILTILTVVVIVIVPISIVASLVAEESIVFYEDFSEATTDESNQADQLRRDIDEAFSDRRRSRGTPRIHLYIPHFLSGNEGENLRSHFHLSYIDPRMTLYHRS